MKLKSTATTHKCSLSILYLNNLNSKASHEILNLNLALGEDTSISEGPDGENLELVFNLNRIEFKRKMYSPGEIIANIIVKKPSNKGTDYLIKNCSVQVLRNMFLRKPVKLSITGKRSFMEEGTSKESDFSINVEKYFVNEIIPRYKADSNGTSINLELKIYSLDKLMTIDKYSQAYLGRKLRAEIAKSSNRFGLGLQYYPKDSSVLTSDNSYVVTLNEETQEDLTSNPHKKFEKIKLQHLANGKSYKVSSNKSFEFDEKIHIEVENEFYHPYLVQYNESFYDFLVRIANRNGEFLYFEDDKLNLGLPLNPTDEVELQLDGSTTKKIRAVEKSSIQSTEIKGYKELEYHHIAGGVLSVKDYSRDSIKDTVTSFSPSVKLNHLQISNDEKTVVKEQKKEEDGKITETEKKVTIKHIYPTDTNIENTNSDYYYNSEIGHDEFFMPLYKDGFAGDGKGRMVLFEELFYGNPGAVFFHYITFLTKIVSLFDFISKILAEGIDLGIVAARTFYEKNKNGNEKFIEKYSPTYQSNPGHETDPRTFEKMPPYVVPFSENDTSRWTTLEYYSDIKRYQDEMEREMVTIKLGSNFSDVKIGSVITLDVTGDSTYYVVCDNEIFLSATTDDTASTNTMEQNLSAIPLKQLKNSKGNYYIAYPPAIKEGVFRSSGPQTAFVVESNDPKRQGRLRIKYPWQTNAETVPFEDLNFATTEEKKAVETYNKIRTEAATPWIRMSSPSATKGGGMYFKPEKGDEVLVNFENGNVERPYVVGALYSKNTTAPSHIGGRVIVSKYGHKIKFKDPSDAGWQRVMENISPMIGFINFLASDEMPDWKRDIEGMEKLAGGIDISDAYGLYKISMSSDDRSIKIDSPLGNINLNAFTGIKISAPNGNIKIEGKNIELKASNKVSISSGKNLDKNFIQAGWGKTKKESVVSIAKKVYDASPVNFNIVDMELLRNILEVYLRPVNGTLSLKTPGFLLLEAGTGKAEIPYTEYSEKYYYKFSDIKSSRNIDFANLYNNFTTVANGYVAAVDEYLRLVTTKVNAIRVAYNQFMNDYVSKDYFSWNDIGNFTNKLYETPKKVFVENDITDAKKQQIQNGGGNLAGTILPGINQQFSLLWDMINGADGLVALVDNVNILRSKINETLTNGGIDSNSEINRTANKIIRDALQQALNLFAETAKLKSNNIDSQNLLSQNAIINWNMQSLLLKRKLIIDFMNNLPNLDPRIKVDAKTTYQATNAGDNWDLFIQNLDIRKDLTDESQKFKANPVLDALLAISDEWEDYVPDHNIWRNASQLKGKILLSEDKTHTWILDNNSIKYQANHDQSLEDAMSTKMNALRTHLGNIN